MKKIIICLVFLNLVVVIIYADDFKIKSTSGNNLIAIHPNQKMELGQKYYVIRDSLVIGEAFILKITNQYCILQLSEGQAYAGDKLVQLNQYDKAKYIIAKNQLKERQKETKRQAKIFAWTLMIIISIVITYSQIK